MKNKEKLNEALNNIDDKMIEAAYARQAEKKSRSGVWQIIGIAASFLFIAAFAVVLSRFAGRQSSVSSPSASSGETEKSVNKNDYEKFNDQGFLYNTEDGLFRFELQTYTADNELFFFTCKLKVTNVSDHDITLHRCGGCDSFFAFDVNMTRGENSQIISYKGSLDESKKELTLKPGKSHEEYLTNSTPISEAMRTTYLQYLHDVYVDASVSLDLDPSNNFGWHYTIMQVKGRQFVKSGDDKKLPEDFSFSLVWNTFGISSYDSKTGKLIKTKDTSNIKKYTTKYKMTDEELYKIYDILYNRINIDSYPDDYDPYNAPDAEVRLVSTPSRTVIISVAANGTEKTVTCKEISFGTVGCDERATKFLKAVKEITDILTSTDEWQALPEYEVFYD